MQQISTETFRLAHQSGDKTPEPFSLHSSVERISAENRYAFITTLLQKLGAVTFEKDVQSGGQLRAVGRVVVRTCGRFEQIFVGGKVVALVPEIPEVK